MTDLARAAATTDPGSNEALLALWRYRHDPLEAEAIAFGRRHRDSYRKNQV